MATIDEVRKAFEASREEISALDKKLAAERTKIQRAAFRAGRSLTPEEIVRRKEIAATRFELAEALEALALSTVDALDNADDLDKMLEAINSVNQQLNDDLTRLQNLVKYAQTLDKVAKSLTKAANKLTKLRPSLLV